MVKIIIGENQFGKLRKNIIEQYEADPLASTLNTPLTRQLAQRRVSWPELISPLPYSSQLTNSTNGYGQRWGKLHAGVDLVARGDMVVAIADGVVDKDTGYGKNPTSKKANKGCGGRIRIWHQAVGLETAYCHIEKILVKPGQKVVQGQLIGISGGGSNDKHGGNSGGSHLHFQLKKGRAYGYAGTFDPYERIDFSKDYISKNEVIMDAEEIFQDIKDYITTKDIEKEYDEGVLVLWDGMNEGRLDMREEVKEMQMDLLKRGYQLPDFEDDGEFGPETLAAVHAFQKDHGFEKSEEVIPIVLKAMKDEKKINKNPEENDEETVATYYKKVITDPSNADITNIVVDAIKKASKESGVDKDVLLTMANMISGGDATQKNGLFRISQKYWSSFGVDATTVMDPYKNSIAAAKKLSQHIDSLTTFLGNAPDMYEIYLSYAYGRRGFKIIKTACDNFPTEGIEEALKLASEELGYTASYGNHVYNYVKRRGDATACEFLEEWEKEVNTTKNDISNMV